MAAGIAGVDDMKRLTRSIPGCAAVAMLSIACSKHEPAPASQTAAFDSPDAAIAALVDAVEKDDPAALRNLLGPDTEALISSGDEVSDRAERQAFLDRYREAHTLVAGGPDDLVLQVGNDAWPLPIPLARTDGRWHFDGAAGADELVSRRVGANELHAIDVMRGFVAAEEDYAAQAHDGQPAGIYAQKLRSETGKHDGLYWKVDDGEPASPAGPLLAAAAAEGYGDGSAQTPYHGYLYRMLFAQGPAAAGGARDYRVDGALTGGYALLAYPADYGASGVMTFMVSQDGVVWQRDLGDNTAKFATEIRQFDPDGKWTPLAPEAQGDAAVAIANPASQHCIDEGGRLSIEKTPRGAEFGVCLFEDNYQCEEWALLRGECRKGGVRITGYATQAARYCAITGGRYQSTREETATAEEGGTCTFANGKRCDVHEYFAGECRKD